MAFLSVALQGLDRQQRGVQLQAANYLASMARLSSSFNVDLFSEAVASDPSLLGAYKCKSSGEWGVCILGLLITRAAGDGCGPSIQVLTKLTGKPRFSSCCPSAGDMCFSLSALAEQVETRLSWPAQSAGTWVEIDLLKSLVCAWNACSVDGLVEHTRLLHISQLLSAAAGMVRVAAALGGWQQKGR